MEHLASAVDRIRTIRSWITTGAPPAGFDQALARASAPGSEMLPASSYAPAGAGVALTPPPGITLAQMLGRPVADPLSPTALRPAVDVPMVAAVGTAAPLRLPIDAPLSSPFGPRVHPVTGEWKQHAGIDLAAPTGTPIGAAAAGRVTFAGVRGGYGNLVIVDHGDGTETRYAHQHTIAVAVGEPVTAGQLLGTVGSTGMSTGPHLHLEVRRNGQPVDPAPLFGLR